MKRKTKEPIVLVSTTSAKEAVNRKINAKKSGGFDLNAYKKTNHLDNTAKFKKQEWIPVSDAFREATGVPGLPHGHIVIWRGHSDTSKTSCMIEAAIAAQKAGKLPVFIITEMKWSWPHAKFMGFEVEEVVDPVSGELDYRGNFLYIDRGSLNTIEDVASFIAARMDDQKNGLLPVDLVFLWDSVGSTPCEMSYSSNNNNAMWNAGAMATQFGNFINQRITLSRKENYPYTNSLFVVNKIRVEYPIGNPKAQPKLKNKGGDAMYWDATLVFTFGNITGPGTVKVKAIKDGREVEWAKIVKVSCDKNHLTGISTTGRIIITPHGFIREQDKEKYKKAHKDEWAAVLGSTDFDIVEEEDTTIIHELETE